MICENCGKEHNGEYGSGRFCCSKCARSFSTKNESNNYKYVVCSKCCAKKLVNKRSKTNWICDKCKPKNTKCPICGSMYNKKYDKHCINEQCLIFRNGTTEKHKYTCLLSFVKYFDFDESTIGTIKVFDEIEKLRQKLIDLYFNQKLSGVELDNMFNYPSHITQHVFHVLNIKSRTLDKAVINSYLTGRNKQSECYNQYKSGWHTTWNNKEVYLRSSYELHYAKLLDAQKIDYDVECLRIKYLNSKDNKYHCAIPDFYLNDSNTIVEIKSTYTLDLNEMIDRFNEFKNRGYNCKLILNNKEVDLYNLQNEVDDITYKKILKIYHKPSKYIPHKWINNGMIETRVNIEIIDEYLNNGWKLGRLG